MAERAEALRTDGNAAYARHDFEVACQLYTASIEAALSAAAFSNRSAALLKLRRALEALDDADAAVALDRTFQRARLRVAQALRGTNDASAAGSAAAAIAMAPTGPYVPELAAIADAPVQAALQNSRPTPRRGAAPSPPWQDKATMTHLRVCSHCGKHETAKKRFQLCSGCLAVAFCSKACSEAAWKAGHKQSCKLSARVTAEREALGVGLQPGNAASVSHYVGRALRDYLTGSLHRFRRIMALAWALQHNAAPWGDPPGACMLIVHSEISTRHVLRAEFVPLAFKRAEAATRAATRHAAAVPPSASGGRRLVPQAGGWTVADDECLLDKLSLVRAQTAPLRDPPRVFR